MPTAIGTRAPSQHAQDVDRFVRSDICRERERECQCHGGKRRDEPLLLRALHWSDAAVSDDDRGNRDREEHERRECGKSAAEFRHRHRRTVERDRVSGREIVLDPPWRNRPEDDTGSKKDCGDRDRTTPARSRQTLVREEDSHRREQHDDRGKQCQGAPPGRDPSRQRVAIGRLEDRHDPGREDAHQQQPASHQKDPDPVSRLAPQDGDADRDGCRAKDRFGADECDGVRVPEFDQAGQLHRQAQRDRGDQDPETEHGEQDDAAR